MIGSRAEPISELFFLPPETAFNTPNGVTIRGFYFPQLIADINIKLSAIMGGYRNPCPRKHVMCR